MNQYPYPVAGTAASYQQPVVYPSTPAQPTAILDPAYSPYVASSANYLNPNPMYPATSYAHSGSHYGGATTRYPYNGTAPVVTVPSSTSYHRSRRSSSRHHGHHHHDRPHSRSSHRSHHRHGSSSHGHRHGHSHSGHGGHHSGHHSSRHHHYSTSVQYRPLTLGEKIKRFFGFGKHSSSSRSGGGFLSGGQRAKNGVYVDSYGRHVDRKGRPLYAV